MPRGLRGFSAAAAAILMAGLPTEGTTQRSQAPLRAQAALGPQRILVLGVSFPDVATVPPMRRMKERMLDAVSEYYTVASFGKTQLSGDVRGWYQLPRPLPEYEVSPFNIEVDRNRVRRLVEDAFNAAAGDVRFDRYDHVIIVVGAMTQPGVGYGMIAYSANPGMLTAGILRYGGARMESVVTRDGQRFDGGIIVVAQNAHLGHVVHDLAHALGGAVDGRRPIPDLYDTVLQGKVGALTLESFPKFTQFMGPWDVMSRHFVTREGAPPGMSSFTRLRMGWIEEEQLADVVPGSSRAVTISPLAGGKGTLVIRIPGGEGRYHLLENRQVLPGDPTLPAAGLLVLQVDESREDGDGIVRVLDADPRVPDLEGAAFGVSPGQKPSARLPDDMAVEVLWQSGLDLSVMVLPGARAAEVQAVASAIREKEEELRRRPASTAADSARSDLASAKELLVRLDVAGARARVGAIRGP